MIRKFIFLFFIALLAAFSISSFTNSLFLNNPDRVGVVLYGPQTSVYLLSSNSTSYRLRFSNDLKVPVPGGYGMYKVGSIGKLASLEEDPSILARTFSLTTSAFVPYYFYPSGLDKIYEDKNQSTSLLSDLSLQHIFLDKSNANLLDRLYFAFFFSRLTSSRLIDLDPSTYTTQNDFKEKVFDDESYLQNTAGYFYSKTFRAENATVQIRYNSSYETGKRLAGLLDGVGVRVVDIAKDTSSEVLKGCRIVINTDTVPYTSRALSHFFGCPIMKGNVEVSDILFELGAMEHQWEISQ